MKKIFLAILAVCLVAAAAVGGWLWSVACEKYQGEAVRIYIPADATAQSIADTLSVHLGEKVGAKAFRIWQLREGTTARAHGSYVIKPGTKAIDIGHMLLRGLQTPVKVSFNNARTLDQVAEKVTAKLEIAPADFLAACDSLLPPMGFDKAGYPAAFLPDTYEFYWNAKPQTVVKKLADVRNAYWNDDRRAAAASLGLTPVKVATLASIVEEETAKSDERPKVARLYLNRLEKGMLLQADPTVKYAVGDFSLKRILNKHLESPSPYNTYKHPGLPPGPIRVAEKASIEAVLHPATHNYLYMCAKEDFSGYHNFSVDYATHMANARRYQAELNRRGIK